MFRRFPDRFLHRPRLVHGLGVFGGERRLRQQPENRCRPFVETGRHAGVGEGLGDFLHLADPAPRIGGQPGNAGLHLRQRLALAVLEFGPEHRRQPLRLGRQKHRRMQRPGPLGQAGVAHLQGRRPARVRAQANDLKPLAVQGLPKGFHRPGVGAGNVEPGAGSAARLGADDPGVDERRAGGLDHLGNVPGRRRGDGVAVHIDGPGAASFHRRRHVPGQPQRRRRRQDGKHQRGFGGHGVEAVEVAEAPGFGQGPGALAAPGKAGHDVVSGVGQHPADGVAHVAGHEDGNDDGGHVGRLSQRRRRSPIERPPSREREFSRFIRFIQSYTPFTSPSYDFHAEGLKMARLNMTLMRRRPDGQQNHQDRRGRRTSHEVV